MMKHLFLTLVIIVTCSNLSLAQKTLSDYSFVVVPDEFEFLSKANQYQLNDMAKYYLTKNGFNTYYFSELPSVDNCDGLWADVESIAGFTRTKILVVLKDCKGIEVYRSQPGASKQKEYKKSYQDALRKAFLSFEELNVQQKDVVLRPRASDVSSQDASIVIAPLESKSNRGPVNKFNAYTYNAKSYLLKKVEGGYNIYDASGADLILKGTIEDSENGYKAMIFDSNYQGYFLENNDLKLVDEDGRSITLIFQN
tara:strand:- start:501 stop:1262 length:762 start_codon:yes stop_codon:yes gene_type:complete